MQYGLILSIALHAAVIVLVTVGAPFLRREYEPVDTPIVVDLVEVGERTAAPPPTPKKKEPPKEEEAPKQVAEAPPKEEPKPKPEPVKEEPAVPPPPPAPEPEPEPKPQPEPEPEPEPEPPPPPPPEPEPEPAEPPPEVEKTLPPAPTPMKKPAPPKPTAKKEPPAPTKEKKKEDEPDPFKSLLKSVEKLREDVQRRPRDEKDKTEPATQQASAGDAAPSARSPVRQAPVAERATISEIDAIRAQIERCWIINPGVKGLEGMEIHLRVRINPDGTVIAAEVLDSLQYATDPFFRSMADSARRAAFTCSPLKYPVQKYELFRSMELVFRPEARL